MKLLLVVLTGLYLGGHAGIKDSTAPPGYSYGAGVTVTIGKKPKVVPRLYETPTYYNYNLKCPYGTFPSLNKRTARWFCAYY